MEKEQFQQDVIESVKEANRIQKEFMDSHSQEACKQCLNPDLKGVHTCKKNTFEIIAQEASKEECKCLEDNKLSQVLCKFHNPQPLDSKEKSEEKWQEEAYGYLRKQPLKTEWEERIQKFYEELIDIIRENDRGGLGSGRLYKKFGDKFNEIVRSLLEAHTEDCRKNLLETVRELAEEKEQDLLAQREVFRKEIEKKRLKYSRDPDAVLDEDFINGKQHGYNSAIDDILNLLKDN